MLRYKKKYSRLWIWAISRIITENIQYILDYSDYYQLDTQQKKHQQWRLAYNYYNAGEYQIAWPLLYQICSEEITYWISTEVISNYNLITARCSLEMYFETRDKIYLHHAYNFYQVSIETMKFDIYAMFRLPQVLQEYGIVMEHYGAFEAAMTTYSKILSNFPNYRGYFHVMYRTTIVGKYIAEFSETAKSEQFIGQCIDTLQFLLEALPVGINDIHAILHYARCLEASSNPANRFRAVGVYQSLYDCCKKKQPEIAEASKFVDFKEWIEEPRTWRLFGDNAHYYEEELIARECYRVYVEKVNVLRKKSDVEAMDIPMLMKMARNCASIQNYGDAANYALMALKINHFNKEVRQAVSQWSPAQAKKIQIEEHSVFVIETSWRHRWMAPGYRKKYYQIVIEDLELKLKKNYFNMKVRRELTYFAKKKWRPHFLFENECAKRIQRQFRHAKIIWRWQAPQRAKYSSLASETYRQYMKTPMKRNIREEVYRLSLHKYVSKKHAIHKLVPSMKLQDKAHSIIWKAFKAYKFRIDIEKAIKLRIKKRWEKWHEATLRIQSVWRMVPARKIKYKLELERENLIKTTIKIQRFVRARNQTFRYNVIRMMEHQKRFRYNLEVFLHFSLVFLWKRYLKRKEMKAKVIVAVNKIQRCYRIWKRHRQWILYRHRMATRIQRMFRNYKISSLSGVTRRLLLKRKLVGFSDLSNELLTSLLDNDNSNNGISGKSCYYINPGIRQNTPQFNRLLNQHTIYCNRFFTSDDAVLLSAVLRNTLSRTRRLIMHCVNGIHSNFEFDLISAISQCRSLRFIAFLGGIWSARFLEKIYQKVQLENPLIQSILVEGVHGLKTHELDIVISSTSNLLLDFFNYSVPGIQTITLQGLSLVSEDMKLLAKGLKVNTSLKYLSVSLNLIEDDGFYEIFLALSNSKKSSLTYLDFSWNLVSLTDSSIIKLFDSFSLPSLPDKLLTINLLHNRITSPYKPIKQFRNDLIVKIIEEVEENQNIKINKGNEDESYRYNKNNNNFKNNSNNLKTIKSENINKISKVKSSLMKKVNYNINIK